MTTITDLCYVDYSGFHYKDYDSILEAKKADYRSIFGSDVYLEPDSQDGQLLAIEAQAIYDTLQIMSKVYSSFSPSSSQSDALSRNVKINGIKRQISTYSEVDLILIGEAGAQILGGIAEDVSGQKWYLLDDVVIPENGQITVSARSEKTGSYYALANTITKVLTPTKGWQSVTNPSTPSIGAPVESDYDLRNRQSRSVALPSQSVLQGIEGGIFSIKDVIKVKVYENDTNLTDANGLPPHSISAVVLGGDVTEIAKTLLIKKTAGCYTHGSTAIDLYTPLKQTMRFFRPTITDINVNVTIKPLLNYLNQYSSDVIQSLTDYLNKLDIGEPVLITKLFVPAYLSGTVAFNTFDIIDLQIGSTSISTNNYFTDFNEIAQAGTINIKIQP